MRLFAPIVNRLKNLNHAQKFCFIGIVLGVPIIVLTLLFIILLNNDIKMMEKRSHGIHYSLLIKDLLKDTEKYRQQAMLAQDEAANFTGNLAELADHVSDQIGRINAYEKELTNSMHTSNFVNQVKSQWETYTSTEDSSELLRSYSCFQSLIIEQLEIIAVEYYLNLANDRYMYNLTKTVVKIMPNLIEQLSHIQMVCEKSTSELDASDKRRAIYSISTVKNLLKELEFGRKIMLAADTDYQKYITYEDPPIIETIRDFIYFVEYEFINHAEASDELIEKTADAIDVSFDFYERELDHLAATVDERLKRTKTFRLIIMSLQAVALFLTIYSFGGFYLSIRNSIKEARQEKAAATDKYKAVQQKLIHSEQRLSREVMQAHEEERKRIARDIHDSIGQSLYSILIKLKVAESESNGSENERLQRIVEIVEYLMEDVRRIAHILRPEVLDDLGFIPALRSYISYYQKIYAIKVHFTHMDESTRLNEEIETQLYRICQEALANISKHAKATTIYVSLNHTEEYVILTIEDNGKGFAVDDYLQEQSRQGLGLYSMQERAELLNGHFSITSQKDKGTIIKVTIPYQQEPHDNHL